MKVRLLNAAVDELVAAIDYYESQQSGLGHRFEQSFFRALEFVQAKPEAAPRVTNRARRRLMRRFPYGVVYTVKPDHILVVAVMHLHRRPGYWRSRLSDRS